MSAATSRAATMVRPEAHGDPEARFRGLVQSPLRAGLLRFLSARPGESFEVESLMAEFGESGMTLVFASHNLGQVKRLATRVLYLEEGKLLADLPVQSFFDREVLRSTSRDADLFLKGELA